MERYAFLDNAKFILVFFVVFGHMIESAINVNPTMRIIYSSIYSFHMPAFVLISGMLAKSSINKKAIKDAIKSILLPFLIFTVIYEMIHYVINGEVSSYLKNFQPYWMLWFLYSLFLWKLLLPFFSRLKFSLTISIILAVGAGYLESINYFLGLSRTLYFFPFFLLGNKVTYETWAAIRARCASRLCRLAFSMVILLNIALFTVFSDIQYQWLYGSYSYHHLGAEGVAAGATRLFLLFISLVTAFSVLMLIPDKGNKILSRGRNSFHVYVWHGLFIKAFAGVVVIFALESVPTFIGLPILLSISMLLTLMLSHDIVASKTQQYIVGPVQAFIFKNE